MKHPMYMIGLTVAAFIGWRMMAPIADKFEEALINPKDKQDYLNPDNWFIDNEEF